MEKINPHSEVNKDFAYDIEKWLLMPRFYMIYNDNEEEYEIFQRNVHMDRDTKLPRASIRYVVGFDWTDKELAEITLETLNKKKSKYQSERLKCHY